MNRKYLLYITTVLVCCTGLLSCYKDKGNYDYKVLPGFYVDTAGAGGPFTIRQFNTVTIAPKLVYSGQETNLVYMWRLYLSTGSGVIDTLTTQKNLDKVINRIPGSYYLEFRATDKTTGTMALMRYTLTIQGLYPYGWMVAHEKDGAADIDLVCATDFMGTLTKDSVYRQLYYKTNNRRLTGSPVAVSQAGIFGTAKADRIYLLTTIGGARMTAVDFTHGQTYPELFNAAPAVIKPEGYGIAFGFELIVNDGGVYFTGTNSANTFGVRAIEKVKDYQAAPYTIRPYGAYVGVFYDQQNMRFLALPQYTNEVVTYAAPSSSTALADLSNIGKKMLYMEAGFGQNASPVDAYRYAFFKDVTGNGRYLYGLNFQTAGTNPGMLKVDISACPGIATASNYAIADLGPFAYYTSGNLVYRIRYDLGTNALSNTAVAFDKIGTGEQITSMKLFKGAGLGMPSSMSNRLLFVATWNETTKEGKVYMLRINEVNGEVEPATYKIFTGFGKIGDMAPKLS
jgi:hypothetical protein